MSLTTTLNTALSGLSVSQQALQVLSNNISNANTPNYSREVAQQSDQVIGGAVVGVQLDTIARKVDQFLVSALQRQGSLFSKADTLNTFMQRVQNQLGQPGATSTIDTSITDFFNALQTLATTPTQGSLQLDAVNAGANLAQQINQLANNLEGLRAQADQQIQTEVANDNSTLSQLSQVNIAINNAFFAGKSTAALQDQRDALLNTLGKSLDISYFFSQSGQVSVNTNAGITLLANGELHQLTYTPQSSAQAFVQNTPLQPIQVFRLDSNGNQVGNPVTLATGGTGSQVTTSMINGTVRALMDIRDQQLPAVLSQLDVLASSLRDQVNAIQNSGSGFPGASSYTGTRSVNAQSYSLWSGSVRIGLVDQNGRPIASPYSDEPNGFAPLTLNLGTLNNGGGAGNPTVQGIIDQINQRFTPQNKAELGDLNNIQMVSDTNSVSSLSPSFTFDFSLDNLKAKPANFFVTGVQVLDSTNTDITSTTNTLPSIALSAASTYVTTVNSGVVTINTTGTNTLHNGDTVFLSTPPGGPYNGIPAGALGGFYTVNNVTGSSFQITVPTAATASGTVGVAGQTALPSYATATPGDTTRTAANGTITANLSGNPISPFYTINVNVAVKNADGTLSSGQVQYQLINGSTNFYNQRIAAGQATGSAKLVPPNSTVPLLKAELVDVNGNELPKVNGQYIGSQNGFLKIVATNTNNSVAIDSMNSQQIGVANSDGSTTGTNRGFSYYFELNNFFNSNSPSATGDTVQNSAVNMAVSQQLVQNPGLVSLGKLTQSPQPANPNQPPNYTYQLNPGDSSVIQALSALGGQQLSFAAAGGLGASSTTLNGYAGDILGALATNTQNIQNNRDNQQTILNGFTTQAASVSGVNLDEELANTILYQNAYTASAKIITITSALFNSLLGAFQG